MNKISPWKNIRPGFLILNIIGRLLSGGGSLLIQISIKFDPGQKIKGRSGELQIGDRDKDIIEFRPARGRRMISPGIFPTEKPFKWHMP